MITRKRAKENADDHLIVDSSTDDDETVKKSTRIPKKKVKKTTEERIKEVAGDSQDNDDEMVDDEVGESGKINTKRLLDVRSKRAKRLDFEQGFFYLPKFDCYLPRPVLHMIMGYIPPFPYFLNIRSISQQWLDEFDTELCQKVKELDLIQRYDINDEKIKYKYPWYDENTTTIRNNDSIRFLALLFPNVEKLMVPAIGYSNVRLPPNVLRLFSKLQTMEIFYLLPIALDPTKNIERRAAITYKQEITDIQSITNNRYLTQFSSIIRENDDNSNLVATNVLVPENVVSLFTYLVENEHFSLRRLDILSLPKILYSKELITFILQHTEKQVNQGYGYPEFYSDSNIIHITNDEVLDHMAENQFFKNVLSPKLIYHWKFISHLLSELSKVKTCKILFEQSELPLVFDGEINPLLWIIKNNNSSQLPDIIEFLFTLNPSLVTLGDANGVVNGDEKNMNILHLYITTCKTIEERVVSSLINIGCNIKYVCPTTGNNLIHIHPCSPYAFAKAYQKFGLSINDVKFEKNWNLLHKLINLTKASGIACLLITHGVDANLVDEDGNLPLIYFLKEKIHSDEDFIALMNSISEETLTKRYNSKSLLAIVIEMFDPTSLTAFFRDELDSSYAILQLIANLLSRGCKLNEALSELSTTLYEKDNLDFNKSIFLMKLIFSMTNQTEVVEKILKYLENLEEALIKPQTFSNCKISPLMFLLFLWGDSYKKAEFYRAFYSDKPLFSPKLLENIIDIPNKKIDSLFFAIATSGARQISWEYLEGILGFEHEKSGWSNTTSKHSDFLRYFEKYRYHDEAFGPINIIQIAKLMASDAVLGQILYLDNSNQVLNALGNETFQNSESILEQIAKSRSLNIGNLFIDRFNNPNTVEWTPKHFRAAFEHDNFHTCYEIISCDKYKHDFTNEEIVQILIGSKCSDQVGLLQTKINGLTFKEKFKLFSTRFNIIFTKNHNIHNVPWKKTQSWGYYLNQLIERANNLPLIDRDTEELNLSLLDVCLIDGLMFPYLYAILDSAAGRKRKKITIDSKLSQDLLINWLTSKNTEGRTVLHMICQNCNSENYDTKSDMLNDLIKYISSHNRNDIFNLQDNEGKTPLFHAVESGNFIETFLTVSDISIQNNKGEKIQDILNEEQKVLFAPYLQVKKPTTTSKSSNRRKKNQSEDENRASSSEDEGKSKKKTATRTARRKRK
ncbi:hypothetical protein NAEGRDRAFT_76086 [Naegleria gruberi]|uniref:Ankyrin repeat domain-containing protein n=1 Tax=Naegleria gruberi TaxID=5762 RepID=D2W3W2_NAEGR|nr:uncharacterized protein NAEGRDRAFT_76086 [Naegleria gruberi]EFC36240.1 hypothetical protein NAEGRDRAFT_76086 [Naegleria gruberi]|eukprot:XP_002668984.1 hypothetical protein NAEGRDRAFT_76086 [Naegleria gruberi strain NEG-M]